MEKILLIISFLMSVLIAEAQTSAEELADNPCKTGGVYYAYPATTADNTPAPAGYEPFYISHYGRHGSRYLISDKDYTQAADILHRAYDAGALTPLGSDVLQRIDSILPEAHLRGGDLTPLGVRQHRGIAERMYQAYPDIFKGKTDISARSTLVVRCVLSMAAFCERLKELNPQLNITLESSQRYMDYLCYHSPESNAFTGDNGPWREEYRKFKLNHTQPDRLIKTLFSDSTYVVKNVNPSDLMWSLYWIASDMQNMESNLSFYDIFTSEELFDLWQCVNYHFYVCDGNYKGNGSLPVANASNLLRNIIDTADEALLSDAPSATLRFGHDGNLIPLAAIMRLDSCYESVSAPVEFYKAFSDFKVAPMAGNIQLIFVRNKKHHDDVLIKVLHNEREVALPELPHSDTFPYYPWSEVRKYWIDIISIYQQ